MIFNIVKCKKCGRLDIVEAGTDNRYNCAECGAPLFPDIQPMKFEIDDLKLAGFVIMEGDKK
jgi:hypothetical protein